MSFCAFFIGCSEEHLSYKTFASSMLESYFAYVTLSKESSMSHKSIDSGFIYFRRSFSQRHPTENIL